MFAMSPTMVFMPATALVVHCLKQAAVSVVDLFAISQAFHQTLPLAPHRLKLSTLCCFFVDSCSLRGKRASADVSVAAGDEEIPVLGVANRS